MFVFALASLLLSRRCGTVVLRVIMATAAAGSVLLLRQTFDDPDLASTFAAS